MSNETKVTRKSFLAKCGSAAGLVLFGNRLGYLGARGASASPAKNRLAAKEQNLPFSLRPVGALKLKMPRPLGIATGGANRLYVAGEKGVEVYDKNGALTASMRTSAPATCVAVDRDGGVFAGLGTRIESFSPTGEKLAAWGEKGDKPGQFGLVTGLAVWRNVLYATDAANRKIPRFALTGDFVDERKGFLIPSPYFDCSVDAKGNLYVGHTQRHRVERYDPSGNLAGQWGEPGAAPDKFCGCCNPTNLAAFPDGRVATTEKGLLRLKVYGREGELLAHLDAEGLARCGVDVKTGGFARPAPGSAAGCHDGAKGLDLAVDSDNRIALLDPNGGSAHFFELTSNAG